MSYVITAAWKWHGMVWDWWYKGLGFERVSLVMVIYMNNILLTVYGGFGVLFLGAWSFVGFLAGWVFRVGA